MVNVNGGDIYCDEFEECSGKDNYNNGNGKIHLRGYKSGWNSSTSVTVTGSSGHVEIEGDSAAREIYDIHVGASGNIWISGSLGAYIGSISKSDIIWSLGTGAISYANVTTTSEIHCEGTMSCSGSIIKADASGLTINGDGSMSLSNGIIYSKGYDIELNLRGAFAGFGAEINCESGNTCKINCFGNGCYGLLLICNDINNNCNFDINGCNDDNDKPCPINTTNGEEYIPDGEIECNAFQIDLIEFLYEQDELCDELFSFDEYTGEGVNNSIIRTSNGNVCCRSLDSCKKSSDHHDGNYSAIRMGTPDDTNYFDIGGNLLCNGETSCQEREIDTRKKEYGNTFCNGLGSCEYCIINSNNNGDIHCSGKSSCHDADINSGRNVYCSGELGCNGAIINNVENIYITGNEAGKNTIINSNGVGIMNVYLLSSDAANGTKIDCEPGDICNIFCLTNGACNGVTAYKCVNFNNLNFNNYNVKVDCRNGGINCSVNVETYSCTS